MTRRRYRQDPVTLELIEITTQREPDRRAGDAVMWGDRHYEGLRTTDGVDISSRSKHRDYMRATGLTTFDDYKGEFRRREDERNAYRSGAQGSVNREAIERAIYQLTNR